MFLSFHFFLSLAAQQFDTGLVFLLSFFILVWDEKCLNTVLVRVSVTLTNHHDKKKVVEERVYLT